nr:hypothetical protein [Acetohalobium arabaticum]
MYRKETRWRGYQQRVDYPTKDDKNWLKFVNSSYDKDSEEIEIIERQPVEVGGSVEKFTIENKLQFNLNL